jgi:general secretion pathway protein E
VFSTLHTNDAASAVTRLIEMGVQPFLISTSLLGVLAQRLVRKLCMKCRSPYIPTDEDLRSLDIDPDTFGPPRPGVLRGQAEPGAPIELGDGDLEAMSGDQEPTHVGEKPRKQPRPVFYKQVGCQACTETGYSGRIGIFELLVIDDAVRREIGANSDGKKIAHVAVSRGMISLREDGVRQVLAGRTSIDEVLAATHDSEVELE